MKAKCLLLRGAFAHPGKQQAQRALFAEHALERLERPMTIRSAAHAWSLARAHLMR